MRKTLTFSRRIALASVVSLTTIACSPVNSGSNLQDTSALQEVDEDKMVNKRGVRIVKRGGRDHQVDVRVMMIDNEGGKPHKVKITKKIIDGKVKIDVEGGELVKDDEGRDVVMFIDVKGVKHKVKGDKKRKHRFINKKIGKPYIEERMRFEFEKANAEMAEAKVELKAALAEIEKEIAEIKDKDSAEYSGLVIAKSSIESAIESFNENHFDEEKIEVEIRKMDEEIILHLENALEGVDEQSKVIIELQEELQSEIDSARGEIRTMRVEIEEGEGEGRSTRVAAVEEMEEAMGDMAEHRLKALKKAEDELRKSRIELEKQIEEQKAKALEEEKANPNPSEKE